MAQNLNRVNYDDDIVRKLARKHKVSEDVARRAIKYIQDNLNKKMKHRDTLQVIIPHLGIATVNSWIMTNKYQEEKLLRRNWWYKVMKIRNIMNYKYLGLVDIKRMLRKPFFENMYYRDYMPLSVTQRYQNRVMEEMDK